MTFSQKKNRIKRYVVERKVVLKAIPLYIKEGISLNYRNADKALINVYGEIVRTEIWE